MVKPINVIHMRRRRKDPNRVVKNGGIGCGSLASLLALVSVLGLTVLYVFVTRNLPPPEALAALLEPPNGVVLAPTRLYDRTGQHVLAALEHPKAVGRQYLPFSSPSAATLPQELIIATVFASDRNFWSHPGYSLEGFRTGSHPTLAQRLVASLLLWDEPPGLVRNIRERLLAAQITSRYGREKVMEWFLNSVDYGNLAYGSDAAARVYFNKPAYRLSLAEAAVLAAVAEARGLNPLETPDEAQLRGQHVLADLLEGGAITTGEFRAAFAKLNQPFVFSTPADQTSDDLEVFTSLALDHLADFIPRSRLQRGGFEVITTLDFDLQQQVACARSAQLASLTGQATPGPLNVSGCETALLLPAADAQDLGGQANLSSSVVVLDPATGEILALAGDAAPSLNPTRLPGRPPGSLLTPYIHLAAYTQGLSPGTLAWDIPSNIPTGLDPDLFASWRFQGPMRLRLSLANDYLVPSLQMLDQIGPENVWRVAPELGLPSLSSQSAVAGHELPLDGGQVTLLEVVHAFTVFGNQGILVGQESPDGSQANTATRLRPIALREVYSADGVPWIDPVVPQTRPVVSAQLAYLIHDVLSDETARWPSLGHPNLLEIGRPIAAKLGTTQTGQDAWAVGYTPRLTVGVWVGLKEIEDANVTTPLAPTSEHVRVPISIPAGLWRAIMQSASRHMPAEDWERPLGVSEIDVCDPSGMLPTADCPRVVSEIFLNGNEPTQPDALYQKLEVNRETGRLATVFTPPELIEEQVYLIVPPEAVSWAAEAGLPTPPDNYDLVFVPSNPAGPVRISEPQMFAYISGEVVVRGAASGEGFDFYRLQVGQGLNPKSWTQLGNDRSSKIENGRLGTWDTTGLAGLHAIQLLVVREDQRVESATIQVTVDNQRPEVNILNPMAGEVFKSAPDSFATIQVEAVDDLALDRVSFYLNEKLIDTLAQPPYALPWNVRRGEYVLRVVAFDEAGNRAEDEITFSVE